MKLKENSNSTMRNIKYGIVSTISKGYDAAACAAVGREIGCDTVVTFNEPQKYANDCGEDIAKALGYKTIVKKNANDYLNRNDLIEAEFLASGELGTGIIFSAFENEFKGKMVLMGERGDKIWDKNRSNANREFKFQNEIFSSTSMLENRLRIGYINVPVPLYSAYNWPSIHSISNSKEMQNWSLDNNYDRPIPRRILEEKGIERQMFGMKKQGAGFNYRYDNLIRIKSRMSSASFKSFYEFYKTNKNIKRLIRNYRHVTKFIVGSYPVYLNWLLNKLKLNKKVEVDIYKFVSNPFSPSYLIHWGIQITKQRYDLKSLNKN